MSLKSHNKTELKLVDYGDSDNDDENTKDSTNEILDMLENDIASFESMKTTNKVDPNDLKFAGNVFSLEEGFVVFQISQSVG
ncbi:hypothetical protein MHBO_002341 [Bonamia ostreae]|uniref:Uncharacterized protein n=1 Tax=Bonamia ostreae TaxID=126728 RepID=A0ABV2AML9_9EUKA